MVINCFNFFLFHDDVMIGGFDDLFFIIMNAKEIMFFYFPFFFLCVCYFLIMSALVRRLYLSRMKKRGFFYGHDHDLYNVFL